MKLDFKTCKRTLGDLTLYIVRATPGCIRGSGEAKQGNEGAQGTSPGEDDINKKLELSHSTSKIVHS